MLMHDHLATMNAQNKPACSLWACLIWQHWCKWRSNGRIQTRRSNLTLWRSNLEVESGGQIHDKKIIKSKCSYSSFILWIRPPGGRVHAATHPFSFSNSTSNSTSKKIKIKNSLVGPSIRPRGRIRPFYLVWPFDRGRLTPILSDYACPSLYLYTEIVVLVIKIRIVSIFDPTNKPFETLLCPRHLTKDKPTTMSSCIPRHLSFMFNQSN